MPKRTASEKSYVRAVREAFGAGEGKYGVDRVCGQMRRNGHKASYKKVQRILRENRLESVHRRYARSLTDSRGARDDSMYPNLLRSKEGFVPFEAICSDITYLRTDEGWEYMCVVLDIASRTVLGSATAPQMRGELVRNAIRAAQKRWRLPKETIFHSDRGGQVRQEVA